MSDLLLARLQMAISLGFHIVFAVVGIGLPLLMAVAEYRWLRSGSDVHRQLAKQWAKGTAVFFAVGAVSGTVLSFELGLLWPRFMEHAGGIIGFPFSLEGFAFFTEAIFLGIYLYAWDRVPRGVHWWSGVVVGISGAASALFVIMVNGWMNSPTGFTFDASTSTFNDIDPVAAMLNPAWLPQAVHMVVAAYLATAFAAAGVHALQLLREPRSEFHRAALRITMTIAVIAAVLQPITGDMVAVMVARTQPVKLAAMEGQFESRARAPLRVGGLPDEDSQTTRYALEIPSALSLMAYRDPDAIVRGLNDFAKKDWPPVAIVHVAFQAMVGLGMAMLAVALWFAIACWSEGKLATGRKLLRAIVFTAPAGFLAIEAGWVVTEVGRQPWIISGVMRTEDAVTPMPGLIVPFSIFLLIYALLATVVTVVMVRQVRAAPVMAPESAREPTGVPHAS